jgi:hypothetical protein
MADFSLARHADDSALQNRIGADLNSFTSVKISKDSTVG